MLRVPLSGLLTMFGGSLYTILLLTTCGAFAAEPGRVALVIGNSAYQHVDPLANPAADAKLIATVLRGLHFEVIGGGAALDLDKPHLEAAIRQFQAAIAPGSVALFYYSGHGVRVGGVNYLAPVDTDPASEADAARQMVSASAVLRGMADRGSGLNILVLDACRNNPFRMTTLAAAPTGTTSGATSGRGIRNADPQAAAAFSVAEGLAEMQAPPRTVISFATRPGAVASDGVPGAPDSPYTTALAHWLVAPGLPVEAAFARTGQDVVRQTGGAQDPWLLHTGGIAPLVLADANANANANVMAPSVAPVSVAPVSMATAAMLMPAVGKVACPPAGLEVVRNGNLAVRYDGGDPAAPDLCRETLGGVTRVRALGIWPASWPAAIQAAAALHNVLAGATGATESFSVAFNPPGGIGRSEVWRLTLVNEGAATASVGGVARAAQRLHWEQVNIGHPYVGRVDLLLDAATGVVLEQSYRLVTGGSAWADGYWSHYEGGLQAVPDFRVTAVRLP